MYGENLLFITILNREEDSISFTRGLYLVSGEFDDKRRTHLQNVLRDAIAIDDERRGDVEYCNAVFNDVMASEKIDFCDLSDYAEIPACDGFFPIYI